MLLETLSNLPGVSGDEAQVREEIARAVERHVDEYMVDSLGNLIALKRATRGGARRKRVMLAAHMDEVGLLVTHIDAEGYLHFDKVGGLDDRILPGQLLLVGKERVPGVIGERPRHLLSDSEQEGVTSADALVIDIGAESREDAEKVVRPGAYATFATRFTRLGDSCARGKALDDRVGCAILAELTRDRYAFDFYAAFTTQEEVGLRGARAAAYRVAPDLAIVLEATICDDSPRGAGVPPVTQLGHGPALTLADRGLLADKRLVAHLQACARAEDIPFQIKQPLIGGTDAGRIHLAREGIPCAVVSVPARYIHGPMSVISLEDMEDAIRLLRAALPDVTRALS